jgi:putative inorganic carbon (HCO3(-)) transporter
MGGNRIQGGFSGLTSNPNDLALSLNIIIPFVWYLFLSARNGAQKVYTGITLALSLTCIVVTWSRQGAITFLGMLIWYVWHRPGQSRITALLGVIVLVGTVMLIAPEGYSDRIVSSVDFSKDKTGSADARWETTKAGFFQTFERPFGVGLGMNGLLNHDEGRGWAAGVHNVYLQISTELGLIPGVLFIVLLWKLIINMKKIKRPHVPKQGQLASLAEAVECGLLAFAIGGWFAPVAYTFYIYILAGMAVATKEMAGLGTVQE